MAQFEVVVEGGDLGRARSALNGAGIPTIDSGSAPASFERNRAGRRFLRSPVFWILFVVVLAFFVQRLISPAEENGPSYNEFLAQVEQAPATISEVTIDPDNTELEVSERDGSVYELGYPPSTEESLVNTLSRQGVETVVESSGGGSVARWLVYLLPYFLFFGFFLFLQRRWSRMAGGSGLEPAGLSAVVTADSPQVASKLVRQALPPDGGYGLDEPRAKD